MTDQQPPHAPQGRLCRHCHRPLINGACPSPITVAPNKQYGDEPEDLYREVLDHAPSTTGVDEIRRRWYATAPTERLEEIIRLTAQLAERERKIDAARMIIGPESQRADLLDATDDVVKALAQARAVVEAALDVWGSYGTVDSKMERLGAALAAYDAAQPKDNTA